MRRTSNWANVKLRLPFVRWLKIEAARREKFMGDLVEELAAGALGSAPWKNNSAGRVAPKKEPAPLRVRTATSEKSVRK